jgi:hypothetical protein
MVGHEFGQLINGQLSVVNSAPAWHDRYRTFYREGGNAVGSSHVLFAVQWLNGRCIVTVRPEYVEQCKPGWLASLPPLDQPRTMEELEGRLALAQSSSCLLVVDWLGLNRCDVDEAEVEQRYQQLLPALKRWRDAGLSLHSTGAASDVASRLRRDGLNGPAN